jgi:TRAP-type C4-dicarboxylate transport system permease large subunit
MGTVLSALSRIARLSFERTTMAILPWLVPLLATFAICTCVPEVVRWSMRKFHSG